MRGTRPLRGSDVKVPATLLNWSTSTNSRANLIGDSGSWIIRRLGEYRSGSDEAGERSTQESRRKGEGDSDFIVHRSFLRFQFTDFRGCQAMVTMKGFTPYSRLLHSDGSTLSGNIDMAELATA